jgi:hypothetical protein
LQRRDALLVELRQLRHAWLEDTAVRELLAKGLVNMLLYAKQENDLERRDALLVELSRFQPAWLQEAAVLEQPAKASVIRQS